MTTSLARLGRESNTQGENDSPRWIVIYGGAGEQRRRWGPDMAAIADQLVRYGWVMWREGADVVLKHRCMLSH